jgi:hypothetical protein
MRANQFIIESTQKPVDFVGMLRDFLPIVMEELGIDHLPKIKLLKRIEDSEQPTFGGFEFDENIIHIALEDRHPLDVLRTLAHELVHFKQHHDHGLDATSGATGSPEEDEAHIVAGVIMRNFNKQNPKYFKSKSITFP